MYFLSLAVSIQCLIEAFGLTDSNLSSSNVVDLLSLISSTSAPASINKSEAERQKVLGNEFVSAKKPAEAVECYSKAIELDPTNAIYFSNRYDSILLKTNFIFTRIFLFLF